MISVRGLRKYYQVHKRPPGLKAALRSLVHRTYTTVKAVDGISFEIDAGERVGFLGPNGAGKTTTLKVLSGLLYPSEGEVQVDGHVPKRREDAFLKKIMLVMGQKQQLLWDLPPAETFEMNRAIYDVPREQFRETLHELTELLRAEGPIFVELRTGLAEQTPMTVRERTPFHEQLHAARARLLHSRATAATTTDA